MSIDNISSPNPERTEHHRSVNSLRKVGEVALCGSLAISAGSCVTIMLGHVAAEQVPLPPPHAVVRPFDPDVIPKTGDPMISIKTKTDSPDIIKQCKDSKFISIFLSGTGFESSFYSASVHNKTTKDLGGCAAYLIYGQRYDNDDVAKAIDDFGESMSNPGERKPVMLWGSSFGGIAAINAASSLESNKNIEIKTIVAESSPLDESDIVSQPPFVSLGNIAKIGTSENTPDVIRNNQIPIGMTSAYDFIRKGNITDKTEIKNTIENIMKTYTPLVLSELKGISDGADTTNLDQGIKVVYLKDFLDNDPVINVGQVTKKIKNQFPNNQIIPVMIGADQVKHAPSWLGYPQFNVVYSKLVEEMLESNK